MQLDYDQYQSIIDYFELTPQFFTWRINNGVGLDYEDKLELFTVEYIKESMYDNYPNEHVLALMKFNTLTYDKAYTAMGSDYFVGTEDESNREAEEYANYYLDEILSSEIPEEYHQYFDTQGFIDDYLYNDNAEIISSYDGKEYEEVINNTTYYIYIK